MRPHAFLAAILAATALATASAQDPASGGDDPYRALEDAARPESGAFLREQGARARARLLRALDHGARRHQRPTGLLPEARAARRDAGAVHARKPRGPRARPRR